MTAPTPKPPDNSFNGPKLLGALKEADKNFQARYEFWHHQTRILRARYNLLLEQGFTEAQALHLITQDWNHCV